MRTVDIPGGTAQFKTREELRARDTKLVKAATLSAQPAIEKLGADAEIKKGETEEEATARLSKLLKEKEIVFTTQEAMSLLGLYEAMVVAYLHSWTIERPLPTVDTIGDLPEALYEALEDAVRGEVVKVTVGGVDLEPNPDQNSPTGPSSVSNGDLKAESSQEPQSTTTSSSDIDPSSGERSSTEQRTSTTPLEV